MLIVGSGEGWRIINNPIHFVCSTFWLFVWEKMLANSRRKRFNWVNKLGNKACIYGGFSLFFSIRLGYYCAASMPIIITPWKRILYEAVQMRWSIGIYRVYLGSNPPNQVTVEHTGTTGDREFPTKNIIILEVTATGRGVDPKYTYLHPIHVYHCMYVDIVGFLCPVDYCIIDWILVLVPLSLSAKKRYIRYSILHMHMLVFLLRTCVFLVFALATKQPPFYYWMLPQVSQGPTCRPAGGLVLHFDYFVAWFFGEWCLVLIGCQQHKSQKKPLMERIRVQLTSWAW